MSQIVKNDEILGGGGGGWESNHTNALFQPIN